MKILLLLICLPSFIFAYTQAIASDSLDSGAGSNYNFADELLRSQDNIRFGVFFDYGFNFHHTNFSALPTIPNCCDVFKSGYGSGVNYGAVVQFRASSDWYWGAKLGYGNLNGILERDEHTPVTVAGERVDGNINHLLDVSINNIVFSPFVAYSLPFGELLTGSLDNKNYNNLFISLGGSIAFPLQASFSQYEELKFPAVGTFENGKRIRNVRGGDLPQINKVLYSGNIGAYIELPINKEKFLRIVPGINYSYWFSSPVGGLSWNTSQLTVGIGFRYNRPPVAAPPPDDPLLPDLPWLRLPENRAELIVDVDYRILDSSNNIVDNVAIIEDFSQTILKPLLNYVFFDEGSANIPKRYKNINKNQINSFDYTKLQNLNALETYYHLLNIIGYRLLHSTASIELVGTNADKGAEKNNISLSQARADAVKRYLCDNWNIEPHRIRTSSQNLPKDPTKPTESSGDEENRRVEIYSSDPSITEPILSFDTVSIIKNEQIAFYPTIHSTFGVKNASLVFYHNNDTLQKWDFNDTIPNEVTHEFSDNSFISKQSDKLSYQLNAVTKLGQTGFSALKQIPIQRITIASKRTEGPANDTEYEYYSLILFDFASFNLDAKHNKVIDFIKTRIKPHSRIVVSGYTDIIGQPEVNKRIATERARSTAQRLKMNNVEIRGIGNDELLYDNEYPEGRFYCRTVTISIETPIK